MQTAATPLAPRGESTREALIWAGIQVFGRDGFHATTTRALAQAAEVNQALIAYHFRNKDGLYLAVMDFIAGQVKTRLGPLIDAVQAELVQVGEGDSAEGRRERFLALLLKLTDGQVALMAQDESAAWARLILREQQAPTSAFALLYEGFMRRVLEVLTRLVQCIRPEAEGEDSRLLALTILGQVLAFRAARAGILRHMGWTTIGPTELAAIQAQIRRNVKALLYFSE